MKFKLMALAALALLCTASCKKENESVSNNPAESQKMKEHLCNTYGFRPESVTETPTDFIVEGDQMFSKQNFWEDYGSSTQNEYTTGAMPDSAGAATDRKHYRYTYLVNSYTWPVVHINIDYSVPQSWRNAIIDAVEEWNAADGGLTFDVTYYNYSVNGSINVKMGSDIMGDLVVASCYYPSATGKPGSPMYINPKYGNLNSSKKLFAMVHEIGHGIGIRHTDQGQGSLISGVSNSCKYYSDGGSVMQPYVDYWAGFTDCDLEAYWALYGW